MFSNFNEQRNWNVLDPVDTGPDNFLTHEF